MAPPSRRISYIIPPPSYPPPKLCLPRLDAPRHGITGPLIVPSPNSETTVNSKPSVRPHPQHKLGIASLALDTSTLLAGRPSPEGILYSGGRDGLIIAWDLGIGMKKRTAKYGAERKSNGVRLSWEVMTGWGDEDEEEVEDPDEWLLPDEVVQKRRENRRPSTQDAPIPYELNWETNMDTFEEGKPSSFRQCVQSHTDWVNDILLCNFNQTLISASSDGTLKAWNPHDSSSALDATVVGTHGDYVRCLSHSPTQNWVASGSFDRTIKLWDIQSPRSDPLVTLVPPESSGPKSSVYAIATDRAGRVIASGSPERVVRTWDPRTGKRTGKLVGHTDNIRAILISEDGRYLLTGSADASIKLWSLASAQRCLHTFNHHTESVWSLFSNHPRLETFYSGDRSGIVCKVDMEGCSDVSEGECVVLCRETPEDGASGSEGINKIVAMDDNLVWTATGSSNIKRWRDPGRRSNRASQVLNSPEVFDADSPTTSPNKGSASPFTFGETIRSRHRDSLGLPPRDSPLRIDSDLSQRNSPTPSPSPRPIRNPRGTMMSTSTIASITSDNSHLLGHSTADSSTLFGIPFQSLVRLVSPNDPYPLGSPLFRSRGRDTDVATLYSAASVMSVPAPPRHFAQGTIVQPPPLSFRQSFNATETAAIVASSPQTLNSRFALAPDGIDANAHSARAAYEEREVAPDAVPLRSRPDEVIQGNHGLVRSIVLNDRIHALTVDTTGEVGLWDIVRGTCLGVFSREDVAAASAKGSANGSDGQTAERSPREALETVRERIEGEAVVTAWSTVDTRIGDLTVHMVDPRCFDAEIYADEAGYGDERMFDDEQRLNIGRWVLGNLFAGFVREELRLLARPEDSQETAPRKSRDRPPPPLSLGLDNRRVRSISDLSAATIRTPGISATLTSGPMTPAVVPDMPPPTPKAAPNVLLTPQAKETPLPTIPQSPTPRAQPLRSLPAEQDYFSSQKKPEGEQVADKDKEAATAAPQSPQPTPQALPTPSTPAPSAGGFMGRLRAFGKSTKRPISGEVTAPIPTAAAADSTVLERRISTEKPAHPLSALLSQPLNLPTAVDAPPLQLNPNTTIFISEEAADSASGWTVIYRGLIATLEGDVEALESAVPMWLMEYLLLNKAFTPQAVKVSFMVTPWKDPNGGEILPELLSNQSRLTASRFLRIRKVLLYVKEKVDANSNPDGKPSNASTPRTSSEISQPSPPPAPANREGPKPEDMFELLCNDMILPIDMTLAAVRQFVWRQSGELMMQYRRKTNSPPGPVSASPPGPIADARIKPIVMVSQG